MELSHNYCSKAGRGVKTQWEEGKCFHYVRVGANVLKESFKNIIFNQGPRKKKMHYIEIRLKAAAVISLCTEQ